SRERRALPVELLLRRDRIKRGREDDRHKKREQSPAEFMKNGQEVEQAQLQGPGASREISGRIQFWNCRMHPLIRWHGLRPCSSRARARRPCHDLHDNYFCGAFLFIRYASKSLKSSPLIS